MFLMGSYRPMRRPPNRIWRWMPEMFGWEGGQRRARSRTGSAVSIRLVGRGVGRRDARAWGERSSTHEPGWMDRTWGDAFPERSRALLTRHRHHRAEHPVVPGRSTASRRRALELQAHLRGVQRDGARLREGGGERARGEVTDEAVPLAGGRGRHGDRSRRPCCARGEMICGQRAPTTR